VNVTLSEPAVVAITVSAYSLFTAQPYSLAVIGAFTGTLASPANPAYSGRTPIPCSTPIPSITAAPPRYTSNTTPSFTFSADIGAPNYLPGRTRMAGAVSASPSSPFADEVVNSPLSLTFCSGVLLDMRFLISTKTLPVLNCAAHDQYAMEGYHLHDGRYWTSVGRGGGL